MLLVSTLRVNPELSLLFFSNDAQMHVHLKRHLMKDFPETDDTVAQWCRDILRASMKGFLDAFNPKDSVAKDAETIKNESLSINKDPKCVELSINADKDKLQAQLPKDIPLDFQKNGYYSQT
ncbi:hypothetical protein CsSME_00012421 [Camellia sinensis var. sinensis]